MSGLKNALLVLGILLSFHLLADETEGIVIHKTDWEKSIKNVDYTENFKEVKPDKPKNIDFAPLKYDWSFLKYIFYFIVIGLVLFLIYKLLRNLNKNPNITKQDISIESFEEIEEKLHEIDLAQLLKEALEAKQYHIALRINFLIVIKHLSENDAIKRKKEKTNWEYYNEIKDTPLKDNFKKIIIIFEPIWYGEYALTQEGYYLLEPRFNEFTQQFEVHE